MGLDIYLYDLAAGEQNARHDAAMTALYDRDDFEDLPKEELARLEAEIPEHAAHVDVLSRRYPEHYSNRRYLRSSYNESGFNRAVPDFVGADHGLYWIFEPMGRVWDGDSGRLTIEDVPKLDMCRVRSAQVADELRACDPLRVVTEGLMLGQHDHMWHTPPTSDQVLDWYRAEKERKVDPELAHSYSTAKGCVLGPDGLQVLALTVGADILGRPAAMAVYRPRPDVVESYVQTAEIVGELIDEALELIAADGGAYLRWSG